MPLPTLRLSPDGLTRPSLTSFLLARSTSGAEAGGAIGSAYTDLSANSSDEHSPKTLNKKYFGRRKVPPS